MREQFSLSKARHIQGGVVIDRTESFRKASLYPLSSYEYDLNKP